MSAPAAPVAIVTGGSRGIGRSVAEYLVASGYAVTVCSRTRPAHDWPVTIQHHEVDVRRREAVQTFVQRAHQHHGRVDALVNCAGISRWRAVEDIDEPFAREILETAILGTLWSCGAAAAVMGEGGSIVNISSVAGKRGSANNSTYCAAKFAINGVTQALAKELGPRGIRVNAICPVYVETERILAALAEPASPAGGQNVAAYLATFAATQTALHRLPTAREVAQTVLFLVSPAASAITGQCLNVDCGALPQ